MSDMITVTIDGIECTCEKGEYIYDVAKRVSTPSTENARFARTPSASRKSAPCFTRCSAIAHPKPSSSAR